MERKSTLLIDFTTPFEAIVLFENTLMCEIFKAFYGIDPLQSKIIINNASTLSKDKLFMGEPVDSQIKK